MTSIYDSTRLRVVADTPLGNAINEAYPNGFEVTDSNAGCYLVSRLEPGRKWREPMEHPSTPKPVRNSWREHKSVWVPADWCEEAANIPPTLPDWFESARQTAESIIDGDLWEECAVDAARLLIKALGYIHDQSN